MACKAMSKADVLRCPLCSKKSQSKTSLSHHINKHLGYRKYECLSCTELFFTEEDRNEHCMREGHIHSFGVKVLPYCELYARKMLKDAERAAVEGLENIVIQRCQAELQYDIAMINLLEKGDIRRSIAKAEHLQTPFSTNQRQSSSKDNADEEGAERVPSTKANNNLSSTKQGSDQFCSENWMSIVDRYSTATEVIGETLRSSSPQTHCMICGTKTPSDYVLRRLHVSSSHMDKSHEQSDYLEILFDLMKKAYPALSYNDLQCQIGGCGKEYKCQSSRRAHVLRIHFQHDLRCPLNCSYRSNSFSHVNFHLKESHGLKNGYLSIESKHLRKQFLNKRAQHNNLLQKLVILAFPCPVPDFKYQFMHTERSSCGATQRLISRIRERERKFQKPPSLRLLSRSSSSDSDSPEVKIEVTAPKRDRV